MTIVLQIIVTMVFDKTYSLSRRSSDFPHHLVDNQQRHGQYVNRLDTDSHTSNVCQEGINGEQFLTSPSVSNQLRRTTVSVQPSLEGPGSSLFDDQQQKLSVLRKSNSLNLIKDIECEDLHPKETTIIVESIRREAAASFLSHKQEGQEIPSLNVTPKRQGNDIAGQNQIKIDIQTNPRHSTPLPGKVSSQRDIPQESLHSFSSQFQDNTDNYSIQSTSRLISVKSEPNLTDNFLKDSKFIESNQHNLLKPEKLNNSKEIKTWEDCTFTKRYPESQRKKSSPEPPMKVKSNKSTMKKKSSENPVFGYFNHGWNWPEFAAEFIGTFVLMMINNGVVLVFTLLKPVTVDTLAMGYVAGKPFIIYSTLFGLTCSLT